MGKMKTHTSLTAILLAGLTSGLIAQSAENFQSSGGKPGETAQQLADEAQTEVIDEEAARELLTAPSRYAGLDQDAHIRAIASSFSMRTRDTDPFARHQDPNFKPIQPVIAKSRVPQYKKEPITPFSDIVERINITAVLPAQQIFLVDERSFTVGDRIKLDIGKDQPIAIHVIEIRADGVTFRHGTTGETADRSLQLIPEGMSRGKTVHPPGMVPKNSNAPLDARPRNSISSRR
jgi:hypothetical protein